MKYHNSGDLPKEEHYGVLVYESFTIPGDERSRTHPGHGYPESTEHVVKYISFSSKEELEEWIAKQGKHRSFTPILCKPLVITQTTTVNVG